MNDPRNQPATTGLPHAQPYCMTSKFTNNGPYPCPIMASTLVTVKTITYDLNISTQF